MAITAADTEVCPASTMDYSSFRLPNSTIGKGMRRCRSSSAGEIEVLVSTTSIEGRSLVPNATVMWSSKPSSLGCPIYTSFAAGSGRAAKEPLLLVTARNINDTGEGADNPHAGGFERWFL